MSLRICLLVWPCCESSSAPAGIIPTRYSSCLISRGTPTIIMLSFRRRCPGIGSVKEFPVRLWPKIQKLRGKRFNRFPLPQAGERLG